MLCWEIGKQDLSKFKHKHCIEFIKKFKQQIADNNNNDIFKNISKYIENITNLQTQLENNIPQDTIDSLTNLYKQILLKNLVTNI